MKASQLSSKGLKVFASLVVLLLTHAPGATDAVQAQDSGGTIRGKVNLPAQVQVAPRAQTSRYRTTAPSDDSRAGNEKPDVANVVVYLEGAGLDKTERSERTT